MKLVLLLYVAAAQNFRNIETKKSQRKRLRIAVIGGSVSGSFLSKYLTDYDSNCLAIDSITILDPFKYAAPLTDLESNSIHQVYPFIGLDNIEYNHSLGRVLTDTLNNNENSENRLNQPQQGGRISTLILPDGTNIELGASIIYEGNKLVMDMIQNDPTLQVGEPHGSSNLLKAGTIMGESGTNNTTSNQTDDPSNRTIGTEYFNSWGIFNGFRGLSWPIFITSQMSFFQKRMTFLWRYHYDLYRINRATDRALQSFRHIYALLDDTSASAIRFRSPDDIWRAVGLWKVASCSFDELLNNLRFSPSTYDYWHEDASKRSLLSWWKTVVQRIVGITQGRSVLRHELLTAINLANNNQGNDQMTGTSSAIL